MRKGWLWPVLVVGLLLVSVTANLVILFVATNDPSFAVEKDYYTKAVNWDEKRAQDARNLALGWNVDLAAVPTMEDAVVGLEDTAVECPEMEMILRGLDPQDLWWGINALPWEF